MIDFLASPAMPSVNLHQEPAIGPGHRRVQQNGLATHHSGRLGLTPILDPADLDGFEPELARGLVSPLKKNALYKIKPVGAHFSSVVGLDRSLAKILEGTGSGELPRVVDIEEISPELRDERHLGLVGALSFASMIFEAPSVDTVAMSTKVYPYSLLDNCRLGRGKHGAQVTSVDNNQTRKEFEGRQITKLLRVFGLEVKAFSGFMTAKFNNSGTLHVYQEGTKINIHVSSRADWDALVESGFAEILSNINGLNASELDAETRWALGAFDTLDFIGPRDGDSVSINKSDAPNGLSVGQPSDFDLFQSAYLAYLHTTYLETQIVKDFDLLGRSVAALVKRESFQIPQFEMGKYVEGATINPFNAGPVSVRSVPEMLLELARRLPTDSPGSFHLALHIANHLMGQIELGYYG